MYSPYSNFNGCPNSNLQKFLKTRKNPIKNQALPWLYLQSPSIQNRPPAFQPFKTMTILKSAGHVSEVYYASEVVCFLMTTFTSCTFDGNVPNSRNVEAFSVCHMEGTWKWVLLLDHLVKAKLARFLQRSYLFFFFYFFLFLHLPFIIKFSVIWNLPS